MTRPIEPLHPSHPAHIVHHQICNHILRRIYKPSPDDPSKTGCICSHPPEEIVRPICLERGGIPCRIDELTYEVASLPIECNSCAERNSSSSSSRGSDEGSSEGEIMAKERGGEGVVKSGRKRKGKGRVSGKTSKRVGMSHTPATKLAMGFGGLGIESPSSASSGSSSSKKEKRGNSKRRSKESNRSRDTEEEKAWKQLRSGPVGGF
ncbi:hypothetical protein TWF173_000283 [Orbilia oligospora]|nr:hypothetical protein TWF173_000283 [Orbilia oligospora]